VFLSFSWKTYNKLASFDSYDRALIETFHRIYAGRQGSRYNLRLCVNSVYILALRDTFSASPITRMRSILANASIGAPNITNGLATQSVLAVRESWYISPVEGDISVRIILPGGEYFGNLCTIDPRPFNVSDPRTTRMFEVFAHLISLQLDSENKRRGAVDELLQ
jgi:hypothetical protein